MADDSRLTRRRLLRTGGLLSAGGLVALGGRAAARSAGVARAFDIDDDGDRAVAFVAAPDPAGPGRVRHATSDGTATTDYVVSLAQVANRQLTLGDLSAGPFEHEYHATADETGMAPDEAWVVLNARADGREGRHAVLRTQIDPGSRGEWRTRDVAAELDGGGDPSNLTEWKEFDPGSREVTRLGTDIVSRFGADARVQAVGVGRGTPTTGASVADTYYRGFTVPGGAVTLPTTDSPGRGPP